MVRIAGQDVVPQQGQTDEMAVDDIREVRESQKPANGWTVI